MDEAKVNAENIEKDCQMKPKKTERSKSISDSSKQITKSIVSVIENSKSEFFKRKCLCAVQADDFEELEKKIKNRLKKLLKQQENMVCRPENEENYCQNSQFENSLNQYLPIRNRTRSSPLRPVQREDESSCINDCKTLTPLLPLPKTPEKLKPENTERRISPSPERKQRKKRKKPNKKEIFTSKDLEKLLSKDTGRPRNKRADIKTIEQHKIEKLEENLEMMERFGNEAIDTSLLCEFINGVSSTNIESFSPILKSTNNKSTVDDTPVKNRDNPPAENFSCSSPRQVCQVNRLPAFSDVYGSNQKNSSISLARMNSVDMNNNENVSAMDTCSSNTCSMSVLPHDDIDFVKETADKSKLFERSPNTLQMTVNLVDNNQVLEEFFKDMSSQETMTLYESALEICKDVDLDFPASIRVDDMADQCNIAEDQVSTNHASPCHFSTNQVLLNQVVPNETSLNHSSNHASPNQIAIDRVSSKHSLANQLSQIPVTTDQQILRQFTASQCTQNPALSNQIAADQNQVSFNGIELEQITRSYEVSQNDIAPSRGVPDHIVPIRDAPDQNDWLETFENDEFWCQNAENVNYDVFELPAEELFRIDSREEKKFDVMLM